MFQGMLALLREGVKLPENTVRLRSFCRGTRSWIVPLVALLMLLMMAVPAELWRSPDNDASYQGFDSSLIYVSEKGDARSAGLVEISATSLKLIALPGSRPTVHLVTTPLSFSAAMRVRVLESGNGVSPFRIGIWAPRVGDGYFLDFGPPPGHVVTAQTIRAGATGQTLIGGQVVKRAVLGNYSPAQDYYLAIDLNKKSGVISVRLASQEAPPTMGPMIRLVGGPRSPEYGDIIGEPVPIRGGKRYSFGGLVKSILGTGAYKIAVQWFDKDMKFLGVANDWRSVRQLTGWSREVFTALAPPEAALARMNLGSGDDTQLFFADLFLSEADNPGVNVLPNGDFRTGPRGWSIVGHPLRTLEVVGSQPVSWKSLVKADEAPDLFGSLRLSLTASAASTSRLASTIVEDYSLVLPHQRWQVVKVRDARVGGLVVLLLSLGTLLLGAKAVLWTRESSGRRPESGLWACASRALLKEIPALKALNPGIVAAILAFLLMNTLLFNLGSLPFDMTAAKVWAYVAARYSLSQLYYLPNIVSLAKVWGGAPYHEGVFPYHPVLGYYFGLIGWTYKLFLKGPGPFQADTFGLEFLIKSLNVLFSLGDATLIFLILKELNLTRRAALAGAALFLLNPAVLFSTSVWGQNHVVTIFPLLVCVWLAEKKRPFLAWMALTLTALTRPQMLVPGTLLGIALFRKFPFKETLNSISWAVIVSFLLLAPFSLTISPSLPIDVLANQISVQEGGRNEAALTTVSLDAYSIWPLVTRFAAGKSGLDRFYHPSGARLIGEMSFQQVSLLIVTAVIAIAILLLISQRSGTRSQPGAYLPLASAGTVGFLILKTGLASTHFIIGLPFLILCRRSLTRVAYYTLVGIWTATTYTSMYSAFANGISNPAYATFALHPSRNVITRFYMAIPTVDWIVTLASLANTMVFVFLAYSAASKWLRGPDSVEGRNRHQDVAE